jgi:hypothetical protein
MFSHTISKYNARYSHNQTIWGYPEKSSEILTQEEVRLNVSLPVKNRSVERNVKRENLQEYRKSVSERLMYLSDNLDDDQDREIFERSKKVVDKFIGCVKIIDHPLISVDNTGYIVFEWRNYNQYDVVMVLFKTNENVSLVGLKQKKKTILKVSGLISEIAKFFQKMKDE